MWYAVAGLLFATAAAGCALHRYRHYDGRGLVLAVDAPSRTVTISHERIAHFMEPMIMPFEVREPQLLAGIVAGDRVDFRLAVAQNRSYVESLKVVSGPRVEPASWQTRPVSSLVPLGAPVPDFGLTDQRDRLVTLSQLRGKLVAVSFIYTRCPLPDYCPRMTANFAALARRFGSELDRRLVLLSVTLDPQYDTPEVLRAYARRSGAETVGWHFLTGERYDVARVCAMLGVEFWPDEGAITHNLQTALIDPSGRLAANVEGKDYTARQLGDLVERLLR